MPHQRRSRPPRHRALVAGALAAAVLTGACSDIASESPLEGARKSPEALAEAALVAVAANDPEGLEALRVTRDEYEELLWPLLPDREQMPFAFSWGMTHPKSRKARSRVLGEFGGVGFELLAVELGDDVEEYPGLTLYRDARMRVRRVDTGQEGVFPLMDAIVVMGGGWKFLNFDEDVS